MISFRLIQRVSLSIPTKVVLGLRQVNANIAHRPGVGFRGMSTGDLKARMDALADLFVEARDEIEFASESKETTYFNEEAEAAQEAVTAAIDEYRNILGSLEEPEKGEFQRGNGLKMEQLKAELEILLESDDH